jgi:hypothetical protein
MLDLEYKCWRCDGTGYVQVHGHFEPEECAYCTMGYIATEEGERLVAFLRRHGFMYSEEITGDDVEEHMNSLTMHP